MIGKDTKIIRQQTITFLKIKQRQIFIILQKKHMVLQITIIVSVIFTLIAAVISLRLMRRTKFNISWVLISLGFLLLVVRRIVEFLPYVSDFVAVDFRDLFVWFGVWTSIFFATGLVLIRKIFDYMDTVEQKRRLAEKNYLSAIIRAEERERRYFAKEVHDGLGPLLSTVKMSVTALANKDIDPKSKEIINNLDEVVNEAIRSIKDISYKLSPHVLTNFGHIAAIKDFIHKVKTSSQIDINLITNISNERFNQSIEVTLYRITTELITNTMRHANASKIEIKYFKMGDQIEMNLSDNGIGFDVNKLHTSKHSGMGIFNIQSRISSLKGSIDIVSSENNGTQIKIIIPLDYE